MSKVFTANVFITKSRQAIDQLFFSNTKVSSFTSMVSKLSPKQLNDSFIASPNNNEGLERFEYSFGMNKGNDPSKVVLSFVETSRLIEFLLLDDEPGAIKIKTELDTLRHLEGLEKHGLIKFNSKATLSEMGNFSLLETPEESLDDIFEDLEKGNAYYFAFGVGDDIRNWDGPHIMHLAAATLSNDDANIRKVSATFVANINSLKAWDGTFEKEMGYGATLKKFSQVYSAKSFHRAEATETYPMKTTYDDGKRVVARDDIQSPSQGFLLNADRPIRSLLKGYIGALTNRPGNAVVAFAHEMGELIAYQPTALKGDSTKILTPLYGQKLLQLGINYQIDDNINSNAPAEALPPSRTPVGTSTEDNFQEPSSQEQERRQAWREFLNTDAAERKNNLLKSVGGDVLLEVAPYVADVNRYIEQPFLSILQDKVDNVLSNWDEAAYGSLENWIDINKTFIHVETGLPALPFESASDNAFDEFMSTKPEGMNENGSGNTEEYTEKLQKEAAKLIAPAFDYLGYLISGKSANQQSSLDATMEQPSLSQEKAESIPSITLEMNVTNPYSDGKVSGFSPLTYPLSRFAAGLRDEPGFGFKFGGDPKSVEFDFYEETDLRILKLWKKYKIISDSNSSAFVFGDIRRIRNCLYLNDYMPPNSKQKKGDGTNLKFTTSKDFIDRWSYKYGKRMTRLFQIRILKSLESRKPLKMQTLHKFLVVDSGFNQEVVENFLIDIDYEIYYPIIIGSISEITPNTQKKKER